MYSVLLLIWLYNAEFVNLIIEPWKQKILSVSQHRNNWFNSNVIWTSRRFKSSTIRLLIQGLENSGFPHTSPFVRSTVIGGDSVFTLRTIPIKWEWVHYFGFAMSCNWSTPMIPTSISYTLMLDTWIKQWYWPANLYHTIIRYTTKTIVVWEWRSNFIPHFPGHMNIHRAVHHHNKYQADIWHLFTVRAVMSFGMGGQNTRQAVGQTNERM